MKLFFSYIKDRRFSLLLDLSFLLVFFSIFLLYGLPMEAFLYGSLLCIIFYLLYESIGYIRYKRKHELLKNLYSSIENSLENLPESDSLSEKDYQILIKELGRINRELNDAFRIKYQESLDYYATWAHQIKTPIIVMQMILSSEDTEEHQELKSELFRIEQYVEMVLNYVRLDSRSKDLVIKYYSLDELIRESIRKYASLFIRKKLKLVYEGTDAEVLTDKKWLCFMIEQILSNAIKYTRDGSITISVSSDKLLTIQDTGIGISEEDLPRIFEKGFTGYNGRAENKSTGIGLYLCKETASRLGITLTASSKPGCGTSVSMDLSTDQLEVE